MPINVEYIAPFITAAAEVLRAEAGLEVKRGKLWLEQGGIKIQGVGTVISLLGEIEGMVMFGMPMPMCLKLISHIAGQDFTEFNELAQSGIAEIGNVIAGRAATRLSQAGLGTDISVPTLVIGQGVTISVLKVERLVVPLETDFGTMEIHLAIRDK